MISFVDKPIPWDFEEKQNMINDLIMFVMSNPCWSEVFSFLQSFGYIQEMIERERESWMFLGEYVVQIKYRYASS